MLKIAQRRSETAQKGKTMADMISVRSDEDGECPKCGMLVPHTYQARSTRSSTGQPIERLEDIYDCPDDGVIIEEDEWYDV